MKITTHIYEFYLLKQIALFKKKKKSFPNYIDSLNTQQFHFVSMVTNRSLKKFCKDFAEVKYILTKIRLPIYGACVQNICPAHNGISVTGASAFRGLKHHTCILNALCLSTQEKQYCN